VTASPDAASTRSLRGRAPHRRNERARLAVLEAADDLLVERGFAGVTIEGIAARAGVAKQTIYRWWPSKVEILLDTLVEDAEGALAPRPGGPVREELREHLYRVSRFLEAEPAGRVLLALIGQAQHDPEMAVTFRRDYVETQRARDRTILQRGIASGELPADLALDDTLAALHGPVFYRALVTGEPACREFTDALVETILGL
jgi:AcrR family transcriptional regulator